MEQSEKERRPYIIQGPKDTIVTYQAKRMKLAQLKGLPNEALRYKDVLYHAHRKIPVDVIVYYESDYQGPWQLLALVAFRELLTTDLVVELYGERMQMEQSFRYFKTHLGLRGL